MLRGGETGTVRRFSDVEQLHHPHHVEAQPGDWIREALRGCFELCAVLRDHVPEDGEEQLVLAGKESVERLQRDPCVLHQLLDRETIAALGDEPPGGVDHGLRQFDLPLPRARHHRRPIRGAPGQTSL